PKASIEPLLARRNSRKSFSSCCPRKHATCQAMARVASPSASISQDIPRCGAASGLDSAAPFGLSLGRPGSRPREPGLDAGRLADLLQPGGLREGMTRSMLGGTFRDMARRLRKEAKEAEDRSEGLSEVHAQAESCAAGHLVVVAYLESVINDAYLDAV